MIKYKNHQGGKPVLRLHQVLLGYRVHHLYEERVQDQSRRPSSSLLFRHQIRTYQERPISVELMGTKIPAKGYSLQDQKSPFTQHCQRRYRPQRCFPQQVQREHLEVVESSTLSATTLRKRWHQSMSHSRLDEHHIVVTYDVPRTCLPSLITGRQRH